MLASAVEDNFTTTTASDMAALRIGDTAPDFEAETTKGHIKFHDWLGNSWGVLFSHPRDHTPVCTTELGTVQKYLPKFAERNTKVIAISCDDLGSHDSWIDDIIETQGVPEVAFPIIADPTREIATLYNMLPRPTEEKMPATVRSVFIIGPDKTIKLQLVYPASTGRNFDEIIRVIDSLQLTTYYKVATPANWNTGAPGASTDVVIVPSVSAAAAEELFPGYKTAKPYLRTTALPTELPVKQNV